jgi:porphobilinogen synthase
MDDSWKPVRRLRRLRRNDAIREMAREVRLSQSQLIAPLFVKEGTGSPEPVGSMPGVHRLSIPELVQECLELHRLGIRGVALFPVTPPELKDPFGSEALNPDCLVLRAIRAVKSAVPGLVLFTDVALDPYTSHGHDGLLDSGGTDVENDTTVEVLCRQAVLQAGAGTDFVAPSDMMDGRVGAIRRALDEAGFAKIGILAYSAKFASAFYGPFREAVGSASAAGTRSLDKRGYQLDPANPSQAIEDAMLDAAEGADALMVKPAGAYLDILARLRTQTRLPLAAYQVSGEYAQIHAAARAGWLDYRSVRNESLLAIRRAGADWILTYFAKEMAAELVG